MAAASAGIIFLIIVALFINNTKNRRLNPWRLLPNTPALVIETRHPGKLFEKLKYGNDIWNSLTRIESFKTIEKQTEFLDSLLKPNSTYHSALFSKPLLIAFYGDSLHGHALFVSSAGLMPDIEDLKLFLLRKAGTALNFISKQEAGFEVLKIINGQNNFNLVLGFAGDMIVISKSESLVLKALESFKKGNDAHFSNSGLFAKIKKTAGKHVNTHLYLNGPKLSVILKQFAGRNRQTALSDVLSPVTWSVTDLFLRKKEMVLNGLAIGNVNSPAYQRYLNQKPQEQDYIGVLPYNTTLFVFKGYSRFEKESGNSQENFSGIDINAFSKLVGNQTVFVSTARKTSEFDDKCFAVIRFNDPVQAKKILLNAVAKRGKAKVKSYNQYTVNKLENGHFTGLLLGDVFTGIQKNYYLFIDDYAIFGNNPDQLINWIRLYQTGKTLDLNKNFKVFANKLTRLSNVTVFLKISRLTGLVSKYFNNNMAGKLKHNSAAIKDFSGMMFQMSSQPPFVYTGFYLKQSTLQHTDRPALWRVKLDDDVVGKPYPVKDHSTGKQNIIVFDKSNHVYLVRYDGVILWKEHLSGLPVSDVYQVDYFKNGKIQYLFNTADFIYLFDKNGKKVKQYPIKINPSATNGVSVFDYNHKKDYRMLLAQSDKRIYNYDIKGRKVKGWKSFKMADIVIKPVEHLVANHKDYLIITDINNHVKIVNRKGKERIRIKGKLNKAPNSNFYVNKTNSKGIFITTTTTGRLVYISASGKLRYTDFGSFSAQHFFLYNDFNNDGIYDFIYVDENKLTVFNRFKKVLFSYTFHADIDIKPVFFRLSKNKKVLGVVSGPEHSIYLFDKNGIISVSKELVGETPFTVTGLKNSREINLITGSGNLLLNYKLK